MSIRLVVTMRALAGKGDEFERAFNAAALETRKESGCQQYHLFRGVDDPEQFVLLERWADKPSFDAHVKVVRSRTAPHAALRDGAPVLERYDVE